MKRFICFAVAFCIALGTAVSVSAVEEGAVPGDYEYINDAERDFVENVLKNPAYDEYNDTSVFEGHKTYLLQENFVECINDSFTSSAGTQAMPAGWDVDRRGGGVRTTNKSLQLFDASTTERTFMTHDVMPHKKGDLTFEAEFTVKSVVEDGFFIEISGGGKKVLHLETSGRKIKYTDKNGKLAGGVTCTANSPVPVKAVFHMENKTLDLVIGNVLKTNIPFAEDAAQIDNVSIGTSEKGLFDAEIRFVHMYINYIVNEHFESVTTGGTPYDWTLSQEGLKDVGAEANQASRGDVNGYLLTTSSLLATPRLTKEFNADTDKLISEFYLIVPKAQTGLEARLMSGNKKVFAFTVDGDNFVVNGDTTLYENYLKNLWYRIKVVTDTEAGTADVYVNYQKRAEGVPLMEKGRINKIEFTSGRTKGNSFTVDDVSVYEDLPLPTGYPTAPREVKPDKNVKDVGMLMYSMWREGFHFGWDTISPYAERTPYQGYYTEGEGETADWAIKWQKEHGITYQIYTWSGIERSEDVPIKRPIRSQAWLDGLHNAQYDMDWCLMWSTPTDKTIRGLDDFKNNILPFWVEYCWKDPNYKRIDNKFLLYTYSVHAIRDLLGGKEGMNEAIALMNEEAKKLGADGVTFVAVEGGNFSNEDATELGMYRYIYGWGGGSASDADIVKKGMKDRMENGDFRLNIPSVPMGYEDSPWRTAGLGGFMTVNEIKDILTYLNDNSPTWKKMGNEAADMVVLTCWDEWGEGHYWCPSMTHGFGYLNAIRDSLTTQGELVDEELPSKQSYARMNVLYPMGRQNLKRRKVMSETDMPDANDTDSLSLMQKIDFSTDEDFARAEIEKSVTNLRRENGMLAFDCLGADPSVFVNDINLPAKKIKAVRITGIQPASGTNTLYYQTTDDPNMGVNAKRFQGAMISDELASVMLFPANESKLTGTLTRLRIDPPDTTVGTMYVKSIEIFTSAEENIALEVDGKNYDLIVPITRKNGVEYMSIYQYFQCYEKTPCWWYRAEGRLHVESDGKTFEMYDGKKEYTVDGAKKEFSADAYYDDGHFWVPIREFFAELGYSVEYDAEDQKMIMQTARYQKGNKSEPDPAGTWNFNTDGDLQNWAATWTAPLAKVENGCLKLDVISEPVIIQNTNVNFNSDGCTKLKIRLKNESGANSLRFFYTSDTVGAFGSPNRMIIPMTANDKDFKEYVIDLTAVPNFGGNIKAMRLDFCGDPRGTVYVDSITME